MMENASIGSGQFEFMSGDKVSRGI